MSKPTIRAQRLVAVALAVLASLAVWIVAEILVGTDLRAPSPGGAETTNDVNAGLVAGTSLTASLAGWALLAVLERLTTRARKVWMGIATAVLIVSLGGPLSATGITAANKAWLAAMHVAVGVTLIPLLARTSKMEAQPTTPDLTGQQT